MLVGPEFNDSAEVELTDHLMRLYKGVHVCLQTVLGVDALLIELDFNETIGIGPNDEVYFCPVNHDDFLDIIHNVWQLLRGQSLQTFLGLGWSKVTTQYFVFVQPFGSQQLLLSCLIRILSIEKGLYIVFRFLLWEEAVVILPCVFVHTNEEGTLCNQLLFSFLLLTLVLLLLQKCIIRVWHPLVVPEQAASSKFFNLGVCWLPCEVCVLLFTHHLNDLIWQQTVRQISQRLVVTSSEASHDSILFLIGEIIE